MLSNLPTSQIGRETEIGTDTDTDADTAEILGGARYCNCKSLCMCDTQPAVSCLCTCVRVCAEARVPLNNDTLVYLATTLMLMLILMLMLLSRFVNHGNTM